MAAKCAEDEERNEGSRARQEKQGGTSSTEILNQTIRQTTSNDGEILLGGSLHTVSRSGSMPLYAPIEFPLLAAAMSLQFDIAKIILSSPLLFLFFLHHYRYSLEIDERVGGQSSH